MDKPVRQIAILAGVVYFIQGALGVAGVALPLYLRSLGWSIGKITQVSAIVGLPWIFKIVYGFISDSFPILGYRRKPYLIICSIFSSTGWLLLILLPPETHFIVLSLMLGNLGFAAVDVVTDGLIVEHSRGPLSSFFQSIAWGARNIGSFISGYVGGLLAHHWRHDLKPVFIVPVLLPLLVIGATLIARESKIDFKPNISFKATLHRCGDIIRTENMRWYIVLLVVFSTGSLFGVPFFFHMRETLGFEESFLGLLNSVFSGGGILGSGIYFLFLRNVSQQKLLTKAIWINALLALACLLVREKYTAILLISTAGATACITMLSIVTASAALLHRTGVEGTFFAVLMGVFNLGQILFGFMGGKIYTILSLQMLIIISSLLLLTGLIFVRKVKIYPGHYQI